MRKMSLWFGWTGPLIGPEWSGALHVLRQTSNRITVFKEDSPSSLTSAALNTDGRIGNIFSVHIFWHVSISAALSRDLSLWEVITRCEVTGWMLNSPLHHADYAASSFISRLSWTDGGWLQNSRGLRSLIHILMFDRAHHCMCCFKSSTGSAAWFSPLILTH